MSLFAWLYARWESIPAKNREPLKSWAVSALLGLWPAMRGALTAGIAIGAVTSFQTAAHFLAASAFFILAGAVLDIGPYYRGAQGHAVAKAEENAPTPPLP